ncbi:hypothetical protein [Streptosporangium roseum]|uniref:hypothetical protein n=1 Tax=Streptosporangium roseum TaxID=2001 RepID=UPI00332AEBAC
MNTPIYDGLAAEYAERSAAPALFAPLCTLPQRADELPVEDLPAPAEHPAPTTAAAQVPEDAEPRHWFAPARPADTADLAAALDAPADALLDVVVKAAAAYISPRFNPEYSAETFA